MDRPRWINKKDWEGWVYIVQHIGKETFIGEFIDDWNSQYQLQIAKYIVSHWNEILNSSKLPKMYLVVNKNGDEFISNEIPHRYGFKGYWKSKGKMSYLPKGTIKALIGKELFYSDEPFKIE